MALLIMTISMAFRALAQNRMRSILTLLGIIIGVGAVIVMVSIGEAATASVQAEIAAYGTNVITILRGASTVSGVRGNHGGVITLTVHDMEELSAIPSVTYAAWSRWDEFRIAYKNKNWLTTVNGVSPNYPLIRNWHLSFGDFFNQFDMDSTAKVAVLGRSVADQLFEGVEDPVGATIRIRNIPFKVVGVLAPKGFASLGMDKDDVVFVPYTTGDRKLFGLKFLDTIGAGFLSVEAPEEMERVTEEANRILSQRHRLRPEQGADFTVRNQLDITRVREKTAETMTVLLLCVASIALLVGGIGIMNVLLISVSERAREIGIRMAVGAKRWHILLQFLIEAVVLSVGGGLAGIALGIIGVKAVSHFAAWPAIISPYGLIMAFGLSAVVGLFSGLYPAHRASRLNPIEALGY